MQWIVRAGCRAVPKRADKRKRPCVRGNVHSRCAGAEFVAGPLTARSQSEGRYGDNQRSEPQPAIGSGSRVHGRSQLYPQAILAPSESMATSHRASAPELGPTDVSASWDARPRASASRSSTHRSALKNESAKGVGRADSWQSRGALAPRRPPRADAAWAHRFPTPGRSARTNTASAGTAPMPSAVPWLERRCRAARASLRTSSNRR